jgi:hypothetical protein
MYMDGDGKLCAGPVWDFDRGTFQNQTNASAYGNKDRIKPVDQWMYKRTAENETYSYAWYKQLVKSSVYKEAVQKRWTVIYPVLKEYIPAQIQAYGQEMAKSYEYDSAMWPTNKDDVQEWKKDFSDWSGDEQISNWNDVINNFVNVYNKRLEGMNTLITNGSF